MSTSSWLQKQRKSELVELAENMGLELAEGLRKVEIEAELEDYLKSKPSLSSDTRVAPFYKRRSESSPVKKEVSSAFSESEKVVKSVKRRVTKAAEDLSNMVANTMTDDSEAEPIATRARQMARTPRATAMSLAQNMPLPPSPSVVVDAIDRRTAVIRRRVSRAYEESGMLEHAQTARETLSSVISVEAAIMFFEAYCLRKELLADRYAFTIPAIKLLHTNDYAVQIPDLFLLLTSSFWGPAMLWAVTAYIVPLFAAYFFNLTSRPRTGRSHATHFNYSFDPLTFNIVKALLTYVVYARDYDFNGLVDLEHVARINSSFYPFGPWSVITGCAIGIIVTFYEAIMRR